MLDTEGYGAFPFTGRYNKNIVLNKMNHAKKYKHFEALYQK